MKYLIRTYLFNVFSLWLTSKIFPALVIADTWETMLGAGFVLTLLLLLVAPILKILFIPINILTFGLCSWLINVVVIYLLTIVIDTVQIVPWIFPGINYIGFVIPAIAINYYMALIFSSVIVTFLSNLLHEVSEN